MGNGNRPTPEFRREAVRLALSSGRTRREIAEDLGIGLSTLTRWLGQERDASEPSEAPVDLQAELKRLRRENSVQQQERDILKKSRFDCLSFGRLFWRQVAGSCVRCAHVPDSMKNGIWAARCAASWQGRSWTGTRRSRWPNI